MPVVRPPRLPKGRKLYRLCRLSRACGRRVGGASANEQRPEPKPGPLPESLFESLDGASGYPDAAAQSHGKATIQV